MAEGSVDPLHGNSAVDIKFMVENVYRDAIIRQVRCGSFIAHMCFPQSKTENIRAILSKENHHQQMKATELFLDYLKDGKEPKDYLLFVQLLEENEYDSIAKVLRGESTLDGETHKEQLRLIKFFSEDISKEIDFNVMFPKLLEDDWLDDEDSQLLQSLAKNTGRIPAARWLVLVVLPRRKENWFKLFLQLLADHGYQELVDWIHGDSTEESQNEVYNSDMSVDEVDGTVRMNVVTASGDGYSDSGVNDPAPENNLSIPGSGGKLNINVYDKSKSAYSDPESVNKWRETSMKTQPDRHDIRDDVSTGTGSSCEDNTLLEFDIDELSMTPEMLAARDKIQSLENRPYQDELVRAAAGGDSVIIVAPTGCGKTVVALRIMQEHLTKMKGKGLPSKIAFFANEVTLVDQQHELCQGHLDSRYKTTKIVGETKYTSAVTTKELLAQSDLLVMTPQIIVDALENKTLESLCVFSLIIFDECHHIREKHPTNKIMIHYMGMKQSSDTNMKLPQVVGLTASVGVGKMKEGDGAKGALAHIIHLCANMDAKGGIVTVREHTESLAEYANHVESAIEMAKERTSDQFKDCIVAKIMGPIEERIIEEHGKSTDKLNHIKNIAKEVIPCLAKGTCWYTQWLGKLYSDKFLRIKDPTLRRFFLTCVKHLSVYNKALTLNVDCRAHDAMNYVVTQMSTIYPARQFRTSTDDWLFSLYTDNREKLKAESAPDSNVNPKLIVLRSLMVDQIKKKKDSRILVLVKTRDLARALVQWMSEDPGMRKLSPVVVTGCGATTDQGGMTRNQQLEAVRNFKWGTSRIAVATSVAEEGMDVAKCSRVIRYEYVSNEIGMIQARGRASRVPDGTYVTLTSKDDVAKKEQSNMRLESVMNEAVNILQKQIQEDPVAFGEQIEMFQKEDKVSRETERTKEAQQPFTDEVYSLHCYNCDVFAFLSSDIRVVANSHRLVITPNVLNIVDEQTPESKDAFDHMQKVSAVHCKRCQARWGSGVMYKEARFVCISIINFLTYNSSKRSYRFNKWRKVHFQCPDLTDEDVTQYKTQMVG
ncbi:antiviral innate immune response receptor RIG-I-like [Haliotis rufescens]|uniref:antiviral innate immune response receptor RIG-I-like n=1 Tax=Haliotis rufescens TaxID=6454 RepID=UPI00201F1DFC|nr:antiviral innate immune response receptor RIG-I-like [Haliotis rufescens]